MHNYAMKKENYLVPESSFIVLANACSLCEVSPKESDAKILDSDYEEENEW